MYPQKPTTKYIQSNIDKTFRLFGVYEKVFHLRGRAGVSFVASVREVNRMNT